MQPVRHDFTIRPGDTEPMGAILETVNLATGEHFGLDYDHNVAAWTIINGGVSVTRTTAPGGGLTLDRVTKAITWPLSPAESAAFVVGRAASYTIVVTADDGTVETFLVGSIIPVRLA